MANVRAFVVALVTLVLSVNPVPAQPAAGSFSETVEVRVLNLEVVVTDPEGRRVRGLRPEDFELKVDGKARPIAYFSEIADGRMETAPAAGTTDTALPAPPSLPGGKVDCHYLVFVDLALGRPWQVGRAAAQLADGLATLPPGDRLALVVFDGRELRSLTDWDDPRDATLRRLRELPNYPSTALTELADQRAADYFRSLQQDYSSDLKERVRRYARRIGQVMTAAATSLRAAEPPPGRRVMVSLAGAWPRDLGRYFAGSTPGGPTQAGSAQALPDLGLQAELKSFFPTEALRDLHETANLLGFTLYSVDLDDRRGSVGDPAVGDVDRARESFDLGIEADVERDATLELLAERTGGLSFPTGFSHEGFEKLRDDLAVFYWLGSQLDRRGDDRSHQIEVRVLRPGLKARARAGYRDLSRGAEVGQEVASHLLFARPRADDFPVRLGAAAVKGRELRIPASLRLPLDRLTLLPKGEEFSPSSGQTSKFAADLELHVGAADDHGQSSEIQVLPIRFAGPAPAKGQYVTYDLELRLRSKSRRVVLALYDKNGDQLLVSTLTLAP